MRDFIEELKATDDVVGFMMEHRRETVKLAAIVVGLMTVLLLFLYRGGDEVDIRDTAQNPGTEESVEGASADAGIDQSGQTGVSDSGVDMGNGDVYVDIGGAVKTPMLAKLPSGSRVEDAIQEAGGLDSDADISQINRAEMLTDGQKIYIPKKGEVAGGAAFDGSSGTSGSGGSSASATGKVNINTADLTQLQTLNGVGPVTAQKIIDYRTQSGRFTSIDDIKNVSGIGDKTFENMRDQITV